MNLKIGAKLAELRKKKGYTQEQLAELLGISAPAISKWETGSAYPDIALLCPLARALDTNVDTILQFEEALSDQAVIEKVNAVVEHTRQNGRLAGEEMIDSLLRRYPNSIPLKFNLALTWDTFHLLFPHVEDETRKQWAAKKEKLLAQVRGAGAGPYWQTATLLLADMAVAENRLAEAEQLLKELPEHIVDPTTTWSLLYLKKEAPLDALKTVQRRLFSLVRQVQTCLSIMLNPKIHSDPEEALYICQVYKAVDDLFGCGGMYDGMFIDVYLRMNRLEAAAECLARYIDAFLGESISPDRMLFSPGITIPEHTSPALTKELRTAMLAGLEEEQYQALLQFPCCQAAVERLKASL